MAISRLFVEIGGDTSKLDDALKKSVSAAQAAGLEVKKAGERFISAFDSALNPTKRLEDQIRLLSAAGKSNAEIMAVMGDKIRSAVEAATRNKQPIDAAVLQLSKMGEETKKAGLSFEGLGKSITDFARNPIQAAQQGITGLLEKIGPVAVGIGGFATAAIAGGTALVKMAMDAAETAEQLQNLSIQTGLTTRDLQALQEIGKEKGVDLDLAKQLGKLNKELADVKGTGSDFVRTLNALRYAQGLPAADLSKGLIPALVELRQRVLELPEGFEQAKAKSAALGKGFASLQPIIFDATKSIEEMMEAKKKSDAVWSEDAQEKLMAFDDLVDSIGQTFRGLGNDIAIATVSAMKWFGVIDSKGATPPTAQQMYEQWAKGGKGLPDFGKSRFVNVGATENDPFKNVAAELARADAIASGVKVAIELQIKLKQLEKERADANKDNDVAESNRLAAIIALLKAQIAATQELMKLSPSDQLMETVRQAQKAGASQQEILQLYGKALVAANAEQIRFNKSISDEAAQLAVAYLEMEHAKEMTKAVTVALVAEDKYWADLRNTISKVIDTTKALEDQTKALKDITADTTWKMGEDWHSYLDQLASSAGDGAKKSKEAMDNAGLTHEKESKKFADHWKNSISTIVTDFSRGFADILFAGKSFGESLKNILIDFAKSIVRSMVEILFMPMQKYLTQMLTGLLSVGTASASTGGGGIGGVGGLAGLGGLAGVAGGAGGLAAMLMPGGFGGKVAGGIGAGMFGGAAAISAGLIPGIGSASFGASLGYMGSGAFLPGIGVGGLFGMGAMTIPAIGAAAIGLYYGIKALIGKSTQTAGAMEVQRDLAVSISKDVFKSFTAQFIDPSQAWGIRKDLYMSPAFLSGVAGPTAQAQGQMPAFLKSLENIKTSWGTFNFREAFELGNATGDWSELNKQFTDAFEHSTELQKMLPDWRKELMAVSDATKDAADSTADLTDKVYDIIQRFRETGEVLPQLRELFQKFGGDLKVLDDAAQLPGLQKQVGFINDLVGRMQALTPQATVLEEIFSGVWKPTTAATLTGMGIDPNKLKQFTSLTGMTQGWDQAVSQFQQSGNLTPGSLVYQGIQQYGGTAGQVALQRLAEGFNTITPQLLSGTFATMQEAYQKEITSALDYLGTVQKTATDKLDTLTTAVETELTKVSNAIVTAVNNGDKSVTDILNAILVQLGGTAVETATVDSVQTAAPGTPSQPPVTGEKPTIVMNNPVFYGYDDFAAKVEQAAILLQRRGSAAFAIA